MGIRPQLGTGPHWGENKMSLGDERAAKGGLGHLGSAPTKDCGQAAHSAQAALCH